MPVFDETGKAEGVLVVNMEVSERVATVALLEEQVRKLEEVDALKSDFINAASHELRTPLSSVLGFAEFLEEGVGGSLTEMQLGHVAQIREGAHRLTHLVDDLLDFARLEAGTFTLHTQLTDAGALVRRICSSLIPQAREAGIRMRVSTPDDPILAVVDPARLGQVLLNLMNNAIKFNRTGGEVHVSIELHAQGLLLAVSDDGPGIPPALQQSVFQKFYQVDRSLTRSHGGAGLGLAISRALVAAHDGRIELQSTPGRGSVFRVILPGVGGEGGGEPTGIARKPEA